MKRLTIAISAAVLALPVLAQNLPNTTTTVLALPPTAEATDSPLVRAAKAARKNSAGKKAVVITNETLATTGGHMATASNVTATLPKVGSLPTATSSEEDAKNARALAENAARREAAAAKLQRLKTAPETVFRDEAASRNATAMSTTQVTVTTATQVSTTTTNQPNNATTASPNTATTSQPTAMTPSQPQTANTVTPPQQ